MPSVNETEKAESVNEIATDGLEKEGSVSNQLSADKEILKEKKSKSTATKEKRAPRKNKKNETLKDVSNNSKTDDAIDLSAKTELTENANDSKTVRAKTKSRVRKKVIKGEPNLKDEADVAESTLGYESDVSTTKPEKKSTKLKKAKYTKTKKAKSDSETSETSGREEKISEMDDKTSKSVKDETKKTRRRGWWSKDS